MKIIRIIGFVLFCSSGILFTSCDALLMATAAGVSIASAASSNSSTYTGYNNSIISSSSASTVASTPTSYKCVYCNGTGNILKTGTVATFGLGNTKHCDVCGEKLTGGEYHSHQTCSHCRGTGTVTYN